MSLASRSRIQHLFKLSCGAPNSQADWQASRQHVDAWQLLRARQITVGFANQGALSLATSGAPMSKLRVESFTISLDGFGAGPDQNMNNPLGVGGTSLHGWALSTRTFQKKLFGSDGGQTGIDDDFAVRGFQNVGAWILGRNMFGPVRGPWPDESWRGWWGDNPVYHVPVFVLTHHARPPLVMEGGTTFHFVTEGTAVALERAREAAAGKDVRLGGGVNVIQQYLRQRLVDEMHIAIAPVLLGAGERLFDGVDLPALGYACTKHVATSQATHIILSRQ